MLNLSQKLCVEVLSTFAWSLQSYLKPPAQVLCPKRFFRNKIVIFSSAFDVFWQKVAHNLIVHILSVPLLGQQSILGHSEKDFSCSYAKSFRLCLFFAWFSTNSQENHLHCFFASPHVCVCAAQLRLFVSRVSSHYKDRIFFRKSFDVDVFTSFWSSVWKNYIYVLSQTVC